MAPPRSLSEQWVAEAPDHAQRYGGGLWILELVEDFSLVGLVRLSEDSGRLELTYVVNPSFWKLGLATKMARTALYYSSKTNLTRLVWAGADRANIGSIKVMQKLGMNFDRDVEFPLGPGVEYSLNLDDICFSPRFEHQSMNPYQKLLSRIEAGETILLDGGTGTEVERRGVPQLDHAWNGGCALSHPDILKQIHIL